MDGEKFTKIIATIGPATDTKEIIEKLYNKGMNVARLNFSHGNHAYFKNVIDIIRGISDEIAIILDTKGPEIRSCEIENGMIELEGGDELTLTNDCRTGSKNHISINYEKLYMLEVGHKILIDDGLIAFKIIEKHDDHLRIKVLNGGDLGSNKTVCIQGHNVEIPFMSEIDKADIQFGIDNEVDFIAASFVRRKEDVVELRNLINELGSKARIISKIEHWEAVSNIDEIIELSDAIMVARGDLGVEISMEKVPHIQESTIKKCNILGKPVIVATQMLESMKENPRPTRAEVSDIAQAILQGADAIMLSGETASGKYPLLAVEMMTRIALEYDETVKNKIDHLDFSDKKTSIALFVTQAAYEASVELKTKAILTPTSSGYTARKVSRFKPHCKIIAMVTDMVIFRQLQISWGVFPIFSDMTYDSPDDMIKSLIRMTFENGLIEKDDRVVVTAGYKLSRGHTNLLEIYRVSSVLGA